MTTIATDGKTMAGDGQQSNCGTITRQDCPKICRAGDGSLIGWAGIPALFPPFIEWWEAGHSGKFPEANDDGEALVLTTAGEVLYFGSVGFSSARGLPAAIGSGTDFALGAMDAGASPEEAVIIASERDVHSGGLITVLSLDEPLKAVA